MSNEDGFDSKDVISLDRIRNKKALERSEFFIKQIKSEITPKLFIANDEPNLDGQSFFRRQVIKVSRVSKDIGVLFINLDKKFNLGKINEDDVQEIYQALKLMILLHLEQDNRADGSGPFIRHPIDVAIGVLNTYTREDLADVCIASLLHDTIEDQSKLFRVLYKSPEEQEELSREMRNANEYENKYFALEELERLYGSRVKELVDGVSTPLKMHEVLKESIGIGNREDEAELKKRNREYKAFVKNIVDDKEDPAKFVIKWQDAIDNMLTIGGIWELANYFKNRANIVESEKMSGDQKAEGLVKKYREHANIKMNIYKRLRDKYKPVLEKVFLPAFENMEKSHPLYLYKDSAINDIEVALKEQYNLDNDE